MNVTSPLAILAALALTMPMASAEDFDFTFTGTIYSPGTVTGELIGLSPDGTSSPTDVILFSNSDGIKDGDLYAMGWFNYAQSPNTFTVVNNTITAEDFTLFSANTNGYLALGLHFDGAVFNLVDNALTDQQTGNVDGVDGVTFTPVDVPEPASFGIFLLGALISSVGGRRSRQKQDWGNRAGPPKPPVIIMEGPSS